MGRHIKHLSWAFALILMLSVPWMALAASEAAESKDTGRLEPLAEVDVAALKAMDLQASGLSEWRHSLLLGQSFSNFKSSFTDDNPFGYRLEYVLENPRWPLALCMSVADHQATFLFLGSSEDATLRSYDIGIKKFAKNALHWDRLGLTPYLGCGLSLQDISFNNEMSSKDPGYRVEDQLAVGLYLEGGFLRVGSHVTWGIHYRKVFSGELRFFGQDENVNVNQLGILFGHTW